MTADGAVYLGLISGTSVDGIDAALVRFEPRFVTLAAQTFSWSADLRAELLALGQGQASIDLDELGHLDVRIAEAFASAALALLERAGVDVRDVRAIGSHGQTVRHRPRGRFPFSLQLGDPSVIAERTGLATVADFRRRDVAAGGHGAPLMPAFHAALWRSAAENRAVLNLGGIANLTLLPRSGPVRGFDSGPANALLDAWCARHTGQAFDADGAFAASGRVDAALLARLLGEPWLAQPPPKSGGREQFNLDWLAQRGGALPGAPADVQATLLELTAASVADALLATQPGTRRLIVCGGGVHNARLLERLRDRLGAICVESSAAHGVDPDFVEAAGFAWLARETLAGRPGNLPEVTGARGARVLGVVHPA